jgi:hypothetical protein
VLGRLRFETEIFHSSDFHGRNIPKIEFHLPCRGAYNLEERVEALFCLDFLLLFHHGKSKEVIFLDYIKSQISCCYLLAENSLHLQKSGSCGIN